jgi:RHS repeat-associated protein
MAVFVNRLFLYSIYQRLKLPMASDANGSMGSNKNKGPDTVIYNYLNLPERIEKDGGQASYTYAADGRKLSHTDLGGKVTNYVGPYVYEDGKLVYIITEKGRLVFGGDGSHSYEYNVKDHLGNTRLAYSDLNNDSFVTKNEILQVADYYPFGMRFEPVTELGTDNKYLYNGKEEQEDTKWYDYGARMYDPALGRWHVPDPLAEYHYNMSPFNYCMNNPIRYIDPFGLDTLKVDPDTDLPNKDIDEVTVKPKKDPEYDQEFGNSGYGNGGGWNPRETARNQGNPYDHSDPKLGGQADIFRWIKEFFENIFSSDDDDENSNSEEDKNQEQTTSDEKIKQQHTGIGEETDGSGQQINNDGQPVTRTQAKVDTIWDLTGKGQNKTDTIMPIDGTDVPPGDSMYFYISIPGRKSKTTTERL